MNVAVIAKEFIQVRRLLTLALRMGAAVRFLKLWYFKFTAGKGIRRRVRSLAASLAGGPTVGLATATGLGEMGKSAFKLGSHLPLRRFWDRLSGDTAARLRPVCIRFGVVARRPR
jgi:hypothetical protein